MAVWHWMFGIGMAVILAVVTQYKALPSSHSHGRKNDTFVEDLDDVCAICRDKMENADIRYLRCCHAFHEQCLKQLRRHETTPLCPKCRARI